MSPAEARWFRWVMRLYPAGFRAAYSDEMRIVLGDQLRDARRAGHAAVVGVWASTIVDVLATAPGQHLRREETVPQLVEPVSAPAHQPRVGRAWFVLAASPIIIFLVLQLAAPGFTDPFFLTPPSIAGVPLGIAVLAVALGLTALGMLVVATVRSTAIRLAALLFLTAVATSLILLTPSLILIYYQLNY